ncbi:DUF4446 family protein [Paenibacillus sp. J2TS4]|uniref:DUF4446 family protein n=1 Tax=Paenibacillus sp. J2TS4 TaxID=2807194 RepID=UPI001B2D9588|nr:DUF4446 family protein [Paenibacillus sp. J2TS4]GIP36017.1 hypothetical protein J2TS4_52270 [Paenibacillus sp. J2TS4]
MEIFGLEPELWESIQVVVIGLMFIIIMAMWIKLISMNRKYKKMMSGSKENLEQMLLQIQESYRQAAAASENYMESIQRLEKEIRRMKGNVEVIRYNAFSDQGSDMSFSIAFMDEEKDGLVLTGIHSRQESYLYAKPIKKGEPSYSLSPEEIEVIDLAVKKAGR